MKICRWKIGSKLGLVCAVLLLGTVGCAHRELTAPCSDYKAAGFSPAAVGPGTIPCDTPLPMARPPWTAALDRPAVGSVGG